MDRSAQTLKPVVLSAPVGWACREAPGVHHLQSLSRDLTSNQALLKHMPPLPLHLIPGGNHTSNLQIQHHVSPGRKQRRTADSSPIFWGPLSTPANSRDLSGLVPPPSSPPSPAPDGWAWCPWRRDQVWRLLSQGLGWGSVSEYLLRSTAIDHSVLTMCH